MSERSFAIGVAYDVALFADAAGEPAISCVDVGNDDVDLDGINDAEATGCKRPLDLAVIAHLRPRLGKVR